MHIVYTQQLSNEMLLRQLYDARDTKLLPLYAVVHNYSKNILFVLVYYILTKMFRALILLLVINYRLIMQWW